MVILFLEYVKICTVFRRMDFHLGPMRGEGFLNNQGDTWFSGCYYQHMEVSYSSHKVKIRRNINNCKSGSAAALRDPQRHNCDRELLRNGRHQTKVKPIVIQSIIQIITVSIITYIVKYHNINICWTMKWTISNRGFRRTCEISIFTHRDSRYSATFHLRGVYRRHDSHRSPPSWQQKKDISMHFVLM